MSQLRWNFLIDSLTLRTVKETRKESNNANMYFIKHKMTLEIILPSDALKSSFIKKQCAAVRTIHSLMIDPAQKASHFPTLKQKE